MDSILINGQDVPVLNEEEGAPLVTHKGHHGIVAINEEVVKSLMFDGMRFWCPLSFVRSLSADENVRKTPLTQEEVERYVSMAQDLGDVGTLIVTEDETGKTLLKTLDGSNRRRIFGETYEGATHVFVEYREAASRLDEIRISSIANTHTQTTHESEAFKALEAKTLTDALPKDQKEAELSFFYAEIAKGTRGKTEFTKRWKRAKYAIPVVWQALSESKITVEVIDHLATLINPDTEEILADLQQEILDSAIAQNLKASQVQTKCAAAFANWEQSQQVVEEEEEEEFDLALPSAPSKPTSAIAPKAPAPSTPKPPVEKVTAAAVVKQKQEVKATKGTGGKKAKPTAAKTTTMPKVTTNAPTSSIPAAIAANPNIHVAVIGRDEPKPKVNVDIYQELLDIEDLMVKKSIVLSNGSGITQDAWDRLGKESITDIDNILSQVQVLRVFLTKIEEAASAVQIDLKDQ